MTILDSQAKPFNLVFMGKLNWSAEVSGVPKNVVVNVSSMKPMHTCCLVIFNLPGKCNIKMPEWSPILFILRQNNLTAKIGDYCGLNFSAKIGKGVQARP